MKVFRPSISVIIAVYNVASYLERCCVTLFEQTLNHIEYIFIDDASTDNSIEILENCIKKYPDRAQYVKIIKHKKNLGIGRTRQEGVNNSEGEYIIHCDPDDWIDLDLYETLYNQAKKDDADVVICRIKRHSKENTETIHSYKNIIETKGILYALAHKIIIGGLWDKLIRTNICKENYFFTELNFLEDIFMHIDIFQKERKISFINNKFYHYFQREGSLIHRPVNIESIRKLPLAIKKFETLILSNKNPDISKLYPHFINMRIMERAYFSQSRNISNKEFRHMFGKIGKYIWMSNYPLKYKILIFMASKGFYHQTLWVNEWIKTGSRLKQKMKSRMH